MTRYEELAAAFEAAAAAEKPLALAGDANGVTYPPDYYQRLHTSNVLSAIAAVYRQVAEREAAKVEGTSQRSIDRSPNDGGD